MNNNNKLLKNKRKTKNKKKKTLFLRRNLKFKRQIGKAMAAAQVPRIAREFKIIYQDGNTVRVSGRDLIYKIPDLISTTQSNIITCIPANPAYWTGTRISALAQGYQNYRPLSMKFHYVPQCAVTQQGNVLCGTLWNQAPTNDNLQQSLRTSNGGALSQCYSKFTSIVRMKTNLQYNLYRMAGQFDQESNPFIFIALAIACKNPNDQQIIPGYFYVEWSFILKNPIGNSIAYGNTGLIQYQNLITTPANKTCVYLMQNDQQINCGTLIQLEEDADNVVPMYNGSVVAPNSTDLVWEFYNTPVATTRLIQVQPITPKSKIRYDLQSGELGYWKATITDKSTYYLITIINDQLISSYQTIGISSAHISQNFGTYISSGSEGIKFGALKTQYELEYVQPDKKLELQEDEKEGELKSSA